ncbi:class I SAM-dependent methyltransferase [Streptacidiphilus pinicola]|nr:methyltransferase domain-containing protein [Streptacidiphilus pinicola]
MVSAHATRTRARQRARDWAEIQERMLVPLYEAVYTRLDVGPATSVLGLGCRSGLALLLAAARGAEVAGLEPEAELREIAQDRALRVLSDIYRELSPGHTASHSLVTAFEHLSCTADPASLVRDAAALTTRGGHVALAVWGPEERCESAPVLEVAHRHGGFDVFALAAPGAVESLITAAGLRVAGGGRVCCPYAYPDLDSALRGLISTGAFDTAAEFAGERQVEKELREALFPRTREDGSVRMENVFRYVIAERVR